MTQHNQSNEQMGPVNGVFDETQDQLADPAEKTDPKVGIGGIKTPAGQRSGPGGSADETASNPGLTTGGDMGTASDQGGTAQ